MILICLPIMICTKYCEKEGKGEASEEGWQGREWGKLKEKGGKKIIEVRV